ncbi:MAG: hypothetical protein AAGK02_00790 [Pseudomonadota bacterium]
MLGSVEAFFIFLLNGLTFEFGDDLYCWAQNNWAQVSMSTCRAQMVRYVGALGTAHAYAAFAGTLVGYAVTPLSVVLAGLAGKPKTPGQAFTRGLGLELVEGVLAVVGQVITDGVLATALWSLGLSAVIAPVRGTVAAFTHSWARSTLFRFLIIVLVLGLLAFALRQAGLLSI